MPRILIVDDSPTIRKMVRASLKPLELFDFVEAANGLEAIEQVALGRVALMVLDLNMPDMHGVDVLKFLRNHAGSRTVPVVVLTTRGDEPSRDAAMAAGATYYLTKPFSIAELAARLAALLRRAGGQSGAGRRLSYGDVVLDDDRHEVTRRGTPVELSPTEFKLLRFFLANPDIALSKSQILDSVWAYTYDGGARVVETYVSYLRRKLDPLGGPLIHTVRGVGYRLRAG